MPRKKSAVPSSGGPSVDGVALESGVVPGGLFSKREAVALRVLMAFIDGKNGSVGPDVVDDVGRITDRFAIWAGWDD